jgi:hypothetical protein
LLLEPANEAAKESLKQPSFVAMTVGKQFPATRLNLVSNYEKWQRVAVLALCSLHTPAGKTRRIRHRFQRADATTPELTLGPVDPVR